MTSLRRSPDHGRARRAFTLVELMAVIVIIGLIGSVAVSSWVSMLPNQEFNTAVRNLSEVLYGTRSDAIARNRRFDIQYDIDHDSYRIRTPFLLDGGFATDQDDEQRRWIRETNLAKSGIDILQVRVDDHVFHDGLAEVWFQPLGVSSYHTVYLRQAETGREFTLELLPLTGEIRMHDGFYERPIVDEGDFR